MESDIKTTPSRDLEAGSLGILLDLIGGVLMLQFYERA